MKKHKFLLYNMNYLQGIFKPMLSNKLKVTGLCTVDFKVNLIEDTFQLEGTGISKLDMKFGTSKCFPMKVSENLEYKAILNNNIAKNIKDIKEWYLAFIKIDFVEKYVRTEVYYITKSETKQKKIFENKF